MRVKSGLIAVCATAVFAVMIAANEKPPEEYVKNMKDTNAAARSLKDNVDGKKWDGAAADAAKLKTLFANTLSFWEKRNAEDAVSAAKAGAAAAGDLETAAKAKNEEGVMTAQKALTGACKTCHDAHRERLPDGSSEIK
jgi:cytochrome c556